eukprot:tig00021517_g22012.t1
MPPSQLGFVLTCAALAGFFVAALFSLQDAPLPSLLLASIAPPFQAPRAATHAGQPLWDKKGLGPGIKTLNRTSKAFLSLSDGLLVLTVLRLKTPTGLAHNPFRSQIERYTRPFQPFLAGAQPVEALARDEGWQLVFSDFLDGPIDCISEDSGWLAVSYREYREEEQVNRVRIFRPQNHSSEEISLPGNARVTTLAFISETRSLYYSRESDLRVFRVIRLKDDGWRFGQPGPFADRRNFVETVVIQPLHSSGNISAVLSVSIQVRDSQASVVFRTYTSSKEDDEWQQSSTYWSHDLMFHDSIHSLTVAAAASTDLKRVVVSLGHLTLGLEHHHGSRNLYTAQELVISEAYLFEGLRIVGYSEDGRTVLALTDDGEALVLQRSSAASGGTFLEPLAGGYQRFGGRKFSDVLADLLALSAKGGGNASSSSSGTPRRSREEGPPEVEEWGGIRGGRGSDSSPEVLYLDVEGFFSPHSRDSPIRYSALAALHVSHEGEDFLLLAHSHGYVSFYKLSSQLSIKGGLIAFARLRWKLIVKTMGLAALLVLGAVAALSMPRRITIRTGTFTAYTPAAAAAQPQPMVVPPRPPAPLQGPG